MSRRRTTRQLLIDWCIANENSIDVIIGRLESILATYQEGALEATPSVGGALESALLMKRVLQQLSETVRLL